MHLALKSAMSRIPYTNKVGETLGSIADSAAAYSLRALNGGDPMVVRVRRSSDDTEKDFAASDMDSGSVADWVNGKQDTTLPCDVASAAAAYSLRSVSSNYTGSVVRVRRSSDDAEKDFAASDVSGGALVDWVNEDVVITNATFVNIGGTYDTFSGSSSSGFTATNTASDGRALSNLTISTPQVGDKFRINYNLTLNSGNGIKFLLATSTGANASNSVDVTSSGTGSIELTANNLDIATLRINAIGNVDFIASDISVTAIQSSGFVTAWYDQSGNGNNATQSTASSQPKIVDAGVYLGEVDFLSNTTTLSFSDIACGTTYSFFCASPQLVNDFKIISGGGLAPRIILEPGSPDLITVVDNNFGNKKFITNNQFLNSDSLTCIINSSTTFNVFYNGNASTTNPFTISNNSTFNTLGGQAAGGVYEVILYDSDQSANRFKIESNINNHYDLYTNANDGFVTSWYDQSGNDNHATQSTASSQPKIVDGGVLVSDGIEFDGVDDHLETGYSSGTASSQSLFIAFKADVIDSNFRTPLDGRDANDDGIGFGVNTVLDFRFHVDTDDVFATANTSLELLTGIYGSSVSALYQKGSLADSSSAPSSISGTTKSYFIGKSPTGTTSLPLDGTIQEIIIYPSDQSANRVAIETNINNHYDIY